MYLINNKFTGTHNLTTIDNIHSHKTRLSTAHNFYPHHEKSNLGNSKYSINGLKFWRSIPTDFKSLNIIPFKKNLKSFLIKQYEESK